MAQIEINTKELYEKGLNIQSLTKEMNFQLNDLFKRIEDVPTVTFEWVGASSIKFVNFSKIEKNKYYKLKDDLNIYGKFLCDFAESADNCISRIRSLL